jgi:hypothetical protein
VGTVFIKFGTTVSNKVIQSPQRQSPGSRLVVAVGELVVAVDELVVAVEALVLPAEELVVAVRWVAMAQKLLLRQVPVLSPVAKVFPILRTSHDTLMCGQAN